MPSNKRCCIPDCISHRAKSKLALHRIPTNKLLAQKWLRTMKNAKLKVCKSARICGRHFERHQYKDLRKNILKKGVVPVLFMPKATANAVHNLEKGPNNSVEDTSLEEVSTKPNDNSSESTSVPIRSYDFNKTCRICLLEKPDLQNMESDFIQNMFQSSDILKFSANDLFPKQICNVCLGELKVVYNFSLKCGKSSNVFLNCADKFTNSEQLTDSGVDKKRLSKTVEVFYVPSEAEMRTNENKDRTFNYKLVAVDGIRKNDVSSLLSLTQLKETSSADEKPILSSTIQAYEIQSSEKQKPITDSSENMNTLSSDNNSSNPRISAENKCTSDTNIVLENIAFVENKPVKEVSTNSSNKRVLRKRKSGLPSKEQALVCAVPIEKTKIPLNQAAITSVSAISEQAADLMEEKVVHHSRSAKRQSRLLSRTAGRKSRCNRSRSRSTMSRSRTLNRPKRFPTRKKVASGNGVYWYDKKPGDSSVNQMNIVVSKALENRNENSTDKFADELLVFDQKDKSIVSELEGNTAGKSLTNDTADKSTGLVEKTGGSVEINAGSAVTTTGSVERIAVLVGINAGSAVTTAGSVERIASSAERNADSAERIASSAEKTAGSVEKNAVLVGINAGSAEITTDSAERTADSAETTAQSVTNAQTDMNKPPIEQSNTTILACQPTKLNINEENTNSVVHIQKRGRGRPRKRKRLPTVKLEICLNTFELRNSNTVTQASKIDNHDPIKSENDNTENVVTENDKCNIKNDNSLKVITKNEKCNIENDITGNVITKNDKCNIENDNIIKVITKNDKSNIKNDNTSNFLPKNEKCNTENSITAKCNTKPGNILMLSTKKIKAAKQNTKITSTENNTTLTISEEKQNSLAVSKTDNIIGNTAQQPTEEPVTSSKDCQHNSDKITEQNKTSINIVENEVIYKKLRHKNVKYTGGSHKNGKLLNTKVNIKHLHLSKKEFNKLINVKLELKKFKIKNNQSNHSGPKISINKGISKKKVPVSNKTTTENSRVLRSSKTSNEKSALISCNVENINLDKGSMLQNVPKVHLNVDKDDNINDKTAVKVSEPDRPKFVQNEDENSSSEDFKPKQDTCLTNSDKMEEISAANTSFKDETGLKDNTDEESSVNKLDNTFAQTSANINAKNATEYEPSESIKPDVDNKCSPDTTTKYDTYSLNSKPNTEAGLPNNKVEHECLPNSTADCSKCLIDNKAEIDSQITAIEHAYCSLENITQDEPHALNCKTECLPNMPEQDSSANNVIELDPLEKSPVNEAIDNRNTDNESKSQLIELLHEFVVFTDQNRISSTAEENGGRTQLTEVPTEEYLPKNYYQPLDGTIHSFADTQVINSDAIKQDAMLSNVQKLSPELKPGVPTAYDDELNESFEVTINNIINTEYNTVCDGRLVGSGIVLEDVAANEEVLPTEEPKIAPVLYQHVTEQSPRFSINCDSVYFNKRTGMICTSLPTQENSNYSSEDEYYSSRFHNTWTPVLQSLPETSSTVFDNVIVEPVPSTSNASNNIVIKHNGVVIPTSTEAGAQNLAYQCTVCNVAFHTRGQLNCHTISAEHFTKRFCKYCRLSLDIADFDLHVRQHENESFCCEYCGEMVYSLKQFTRHIRIHSRHRCLLCPMEFETKFLLSQHWTVHTGVRRDQCRHCNRKFARPSALIMHLAARTCLKDKGQFICTVCNKIFDSKKKSLQHVALHQLYECTICNRTFNKHQYCKRHVRLVHGLT